LATVKSSFHELNKHRQWLRNIQSQCVFLRLRRFQSFKLTGDQRGRHELTAPLSKTLGGQRRLGAQLDEADIRADFSDDVAVVFSQCGAGYDTVDAAYAPFRDLPGDGLQPRLSVSLHERNAVGHLLDILSRMQRIGFQKRSLQLGRKPFAHLRFSAARDTHDNEKICSHAQALCLQGRGRNRHDFSQYDNVGKNADQQDHASNEKCIHEGFCGSDNDSRDDGRCNADHVFHEIHDAADCRGAALQRNERGIDRPTGAETARPERAIEIQKIAQCGSVTRVRKIRWSSAISFDFVTDSRTSGRSQLRLAPQAWRRQP
jgi:hypothetical protein